MTYTADQITVVVFASPIPSHPRTDILELTLQSIEMRLPGAPIIVACDGVRPEQADRTADYEQFIEQVRKDNVAYGRRQLTVKAPEHWHQSGMFQRILPCIESDYLLFMEHDTPLVGPEIPWEEIIEQMETHDVNSVRFMHETHVLAEHEYLFGSHIEGTDLRRTIQFSARPHLAKTAYYRYAIETYFDEVSRCFIEDRLYGPSQVDDFKMAVYLPEGNAQRSAHTNGRQEDPKFTQVFPGGVIH